jgi:DNA polymerase III sliding clamp (beta) subunit (PCNA family)
MALSPLDKILLGTKSTPTTQQKSNVSPLDAILMGKKNTPKETPKTATSLFDVGDTGIGATTGVGYQPMPEQRDITMEEEAPAKVTTVTPKVVQMPNQPKYPDTQLRAPEPTDTSSRFISEVGKIYGLSDTKRLVDVSVKWAKDILKAGVPTANAPSLESPIVSSESLANQAIKSGTAIGFAVPTLLLNATVSFAGEGAQEKVDQAFGLFKKYTDLPNPENDAWKNALNTVKDVVVFSLLHKGYTELKRVAGTVKMEVATDYLDQNLGTNGSQRAFDIAKRFDPYAKVKKINGKDTLVFRVKKNLYNSLVDHFGKRRIGEPVQPTPPETPSGMTVEAKPIEIVKFVPPEKLPVTPTAIIKPKTTPSATQPTETPVIEPIVSKEDKLINIIKEHLQKGDEAFVNQMKEKVKGNPELADRLLYSIVKAQDQIAQEKSLAEFRKRKALQKTTTPETSLIQEAKNETIEQTASRMKSEGKTLEEFVDKNAAWQTNWKDEVFEASVDGKIKTVGFFADLKPATRQELIDSQKALEASKGTGVENTSKAGRRYFDAEEAAKVELGITKSQLTDIWNKANGKTGEIKPITTLQDISKKLVERGIPESASQKVAGWIYKVVSKDRSDEVALKKAINILADEKQNPNSRAIFTEITGIKLPKTQRESIAVLDKFVGIEPTPRKWLTDKEVVDFVNNNKGKSVVIDSNKNAWRAGEQHRVSNPVLNKLVGIEEGKVVYKRDGNEYLVPIKSIRDFVIDGKSQVGDLKNEEYAPEKPTVSEQILKKPVKKTKAVKMKIITPVEATGKIIQKNASLPILTEFKVQGGKLYATDLEVAIKLNTELKDGMYKIVGKDTIKTSSDMADFPIVPEITKKPIIKITTTRFSGALKSALLSMRDDKLRPVLNGVLMKIENGKLYIVSTDSYRMYMKEVLANISGEDGEYIIDNPEKMSKVLSAIGESVDISVDEENNQIKFKGTNGEIITRKVDGKFPAFKNILPEYTSQQQFSKQEMGNALKELKPYVKEIGAPTVQISYRDGKLNLLVERTSDSHPGENIRKEVQVKISTPYTVSTDSGAINDGVLVMPLKLDMPAKMMGLNYQYLLDAIESLPFDNIYFYKTEQKLAPVFFSNDKTLKKRSAVWEKPKEVSGGGGGAVGLYARQWQVEMAKESEVPETINKTEIMTWAEKTFGIPLRMKATHKWKAAGMYYTKKQIVRMEKWGELSVVAHEIAHHIDLTTLKKQYPEGWRKGAFGFKKELADLDYDQKKRRTREGFAEYIRHRMTTGLEKQLAPKFDKFFNEFLDRNPVLKKQLEGFKQRLDVWHKQGSENRIIQHIDWKQEHTKITGIMPNLKKALQFVNEKFNDEFYVAQKITKQIEGILGRELPPSRNPAKMLEYSKSKAGAIARTFVMDKAIDEYGNVVGPGLVEILKPVSNKEMKQFIAYAVSKRAVNLASRKIESGFDIEDARYIIEKYKDKGWDEVAQKLTDWSSQGLDWAIRAGGLDAKTAKLMRDLNPIYLTFKRAFIDEVGAMKGGGAGYVDTGGVTKRIKGSGRPIINPIESMVVQLRELIAKSQKIRIVNLFADLAKQEGLGGFITEVPAPMVATKFNASQIEDYITSITGEETIGGLDDFLTVFTQGTKYNGKENIVSIWRGGKQKFYEIHPDLYESFKGIDPLKLGPVAKVLAPFSRILRLGATGLKVSFGIARNPFRDALSYAVFSKRNKVTVFDPLKGIYTDLTTKPGEATWRFKKLGGGLSGQIGLDRAATMSTYDDLLMEKLGKTGKVLKVVKHPVDTLRDILSITEMGPRSVELEQSYKKYTSDEWKKTHPDWNEEDAFVEAFNDAQDITVNFTKSGKWAKQLNEFTAFFNVAIRGPEKVYRSFRERPIATFVKGLLWLTLIAIGSWYKNKDEDWYKNLPPAYKYGNLFFEIGDNVFRLPIPFELGVLFMAVPQAALDTIGGDDQAFQGVLDILKSQIPNPVPSAFQPAIDVKSNTNYLGLPIESEGMQYLYPTERKKDYTTKLAIALSQGLDKIGIQLSPIQLDYLADSYSGGFLKQFKISGDELQDLPVLSDLMLRNPDFPKRQLNDYFSEYELLTQKKQSKIATKQEEKKLDRINGFYDYYKDIQKQIKKAKANKNDELLKVYYNRIRIKLERYGYGIESSKTTNKSTDPEGLVSKYFRGFVADPWSALETLFTGEELKDVRGDAVIMERMGVDASSAVKRSGGASATDKLDHTVPLELGGDNSKSNLKIVTDAEWQSYTPVENHLGNLLNSGKIKEKQAQQLIKDFKMGIITAESILRIK